MSLREAAEAALEALEWFNRYGTEEHGPSLRGAEHSLRAALAQHQEDSEKGRATLARLRGARIAMLQEQEQARQEGKCHACLRKLPKRLRTEYDTTC